MYGTLDISFNISGSYHEGLDGGVWYSLFIKNLAHYSSHCHFPIGILGQVWYLIVSIPDLCTLTYFYSLK